MIGASETPTSPVRHTCHLAKPSCIEEGHTFVTGFWVPGVLGAGFFGGGLPVLVRTRTRPLEVAGDEPLAIGCPTAIRQVVHSDQQPVLLGDGAAALSPSRVSRRTIVI
jgi:hypothetical protein